MSKPSSGHVYILTSRHSEFVKIGGTDHPPMKRIREVNGAPPYRDLGPWELFDFRQVSDWRKVESSLHYEFRSRLVVDVPGQRELFRLAPQLAASRLETIDPELIVSKPKVDRLFQDSDFSGFVLHLVRFTGLMNWLHLQGSWVFVLFPGTSGGRYFTISIGRHEVAFSALPQKGGSVPLHMILMDRLILDFPEVVEWVERRGGAFDEDRYPSGLPRSVSVLFRGSFEKAREFLALEGVRRALIAYWGEALVRLNEQNALSFFAKHHNWNAVAEIRTRLAKDKVVTGA